MVAVVVADAGEVEPLRMTELIACDEHRMLDLKLKSSQYPGYRTNYMVHHCTTLQYNHNI